MFLANFRDDQDVADVGVIRRLLEGAGAPDPDGLLERAGSSHVKELLRKRTNDAIARGVFGAPSFFVGDELFWGNDRLEDALDWTGTQASPPVR